MSNLTIVMYHYVRDLKNSRYPEIKGLETDLFIEQVAYLKKHYYPVTAFDVMDAIEAGCDLPPNSVLLTFDDAYIDHYSNVFPVLEREKISGCFFPPVKCIIEGAVLDVNKIHFVLASVADKSLLVRHILDEVNTHRVAWSLEEDAVYWERCGKPSRYDTAEVMFVKYMLQRDLPLGLRASVVDGLFNRFVSGDEAAFSADLYMSKDQILQLNQSGMYVGSHGYDHFHLDSISKDRQRVEIDLSLEFLAAVGSDPARWIMCFPYGAFNTDTLDLLNEKNCAIGLATAVGVANIKTDNRLTLPRLDTNDLPKDRFAIPNHWTMDYRS